MAAVKTASAAEKSAKGWSREQISDDGERITHLYPNDCYYAHLSIYRFALRWARGGRVLDAGSGAGYGSAYLLEHGARSVLGVDVSDTAVAFSREVFGAPRLEFRAMAVEEVGALESRTFDFIFCSNVLEHVPAVSRFLRGACRVLAPGGTMLVAVPPITNDALRAANLGNPHHLNIWSPRQWHHVLGSYFAQVSCFGHKFARTDLGLNFANTPEQTVISEDDFLFAAVPLEKALTLPTITSIFILGRPRPEGELPPEDGPITFVDESFTREAPASAPPAHGLPRFKRLAQGVGNLCWRSKPG